MKETNNYIFVYGRLLVKENEYGKHLSNNCVFHSKGKFKGKLYDIGEYPGAVYQPDEELFVYGDNFIMNDPDQTLKILDEYEGFGENEEQPNLFTRALIEAETDKGLINCRVYLYNLKTAGLRQITSGIYKQ
ncbi:gamma-glutamylcyclotransferase family protein [Mucilaginibacter sp.]|uniref:gamma-glutamylcyclotransferase family protein n=1 Tax=Mucilaginibacter sp. TaxID=1882438 RepID=UPI00284B8C97|nr:gamma-glutamylcyclotransferase family protein [Mucilaginibacter sp.]MDR3693851.1 gamma-glutamylcyclotransferase [Mucilaginibacter sp.]